MNKYSNETIRNIILKEFGEKRLKEIETIDTFEDHTMSCHGYKFTPNIENEFNMVSVLDKKSIFQWDSIISSHGKCFIKIYLIPTVYFYCDNKKCWVEEDA